MNERIKELANQLGPVATIGNWGRVEWADNVYPQLGDKMYAAIDLDKFAELIVGECIDIALEQKKWVEDQEVFNPQDEQWNRARIQQSQHIADKVKQHFGVQE